MHVSARVSETAVQGSKGLRDLRGIAKRSRAGRKAVTAFLAKTQGREEPALEAPASSWPTPALPTITKAREPSFVPILMVQKYPKAIDGRKRKGLYDP